MTKIVKFIEKHDFSSEIQKLCKEPSQSERANFKEVETDKEISKEICSEIESYLDLNNCQEPKDREKKDC